MSFDMVRPQVNIRVSEDQKKRWEKHVEESPEHDTLTDLIRISVEREIASDGQTNHTNSKGPTNNKRIGELLTVVEKMEGRLEDLEDTMSSATDAMHVAGASSDTERSFEAAVFENLPQGGENATKAQKLARDLGVDERQTRVALERLESSTKAVKANRRDPETGVERRQPLWFKQ